MISSLLIPGIIAFGIWFVLVELWRVSKIRKRRDHHALWMAAFENGDRQRVDRLLEAICDAFLIPKRYRFRLRPSDDIHDFYSRNIRFAFADSLEHAHIMMSIEKDFGVSAETLILSKPCTVESLVRLVAKPKGNAGQTAFGDYK